MVFPAKPLNRRQFCRQLFMGTLRSLLTRRIQRLSIIVSLLALSFFLWGFLLIPESNEYYMNVKPNNADGTDLVFPMSKVATLTTTHYSAGEQNFNKNITDRFEFKESFIKSSLNSGNELELEKTFSVVSNSTNDGLSKQNTTNTTKFEVCFVTSVYSSTVRNADRPPNVQDIQNDNPTFRFFAFTNLPDLVAPGWKIIVKELPYRRFITQSRWPKFMAWQYPLVQQCQAVFYMDGFCGPKAKHSERYKNLARSISNSQYGLFQNVHDVAKGPMHELDRIVALRKDISKNVEASKAWLLAQPDFSDNCTMYANHYIAYDPNSVYFQRASSFFWDHYSREEDSWRDQPLWCYVLDHFQIKPTRLGTFEALFRDYFSRQGHAGHRYTDKADNDSVQLKNNTP